MEKQLLGFLGYALAYTAATRRRRMPNTICPRCKRVGLVRKENIIHAGQATVSLYCGGCGHAWEQTPDGHPPKPGKRATNPPPDRSRS
jgi:hypothetical protein